MADHGYHPRILIVEDEALVAIVIAEQLTDLGYEVVTVATVKQALANLKPEHRLDAALLDLQLEGEQSFAVGDALVERRVPFAFMTGFGPSGLKGTRFFDVPVLAKPFRFEELKRSLLGLLAAPGLR